MKARGGVSFRSFSPSAVASASVSGLPAPMETWPSVRKTVTGSRAVLIRPIQCFHGKPYVSMSTTSYRQPLWRAHPAAIDLQPAGLGLLIETPVASGGELLAKCSPDDARTLAAVEHARRLLGVILVEEVAPQRQLGGQVRVVGLGHSLTSPFVMNPCQHSGLPTATLGTSVKSSSPLPLTVQRGCVFPSRRLGAEIGRRHDSAGADFRTRSMRRAAARGLATG